MRNKLIMTITAMWVLLVASCSTQAYATQACSTAEHNAAVVYEVFAELQHPDDLRRLAQSVARSGLPASQIGALIRGLAYLAARKDDGQPPVDVARFARAVLNTCNMLEVQNDRAI